jgi:hypothetical protein
MEALLRSKGDRGRRRSRPQSFVTSHQKEYSELMAANISLHAPSLSAYECSERFEVSTYQKRKIRCSLYHAGSAGVSGDVTGPVSISRCATERKITGKEVAYFTALYSGRRLSLSGE